MGGDETEPKPNYFFDKCLKDILRNSENPSFSVVGSGSRDEADNPSFSSKPVQNSNAACQKTLNESLESIKKPNLVDLKSWKEFFFFSNKSDDNRLKDGVMFFKCINNQNSLQFNEVRKKLKQSIRHKMLKRRSLAVKRKFNKRKFNRFMYKK